MKKLMNLKGAQELSADKQKNINGGGKLCNSSCVGRPIGSLCYYEGHCGCPGCCTSNGCIPY